VQRAALIEEIIAMNTRDTVRSYWSGGEWRYGWGGPRFYRGRWNGGGFGPCWTQTPIGPMWNCGQ